MNKIPIYHIYLYILMCANVYVYMKLSKIYFLQSGYYKECNLEFRNINSDIRTKLGEIFIALYFLGGYFQL